MDCKEFERKIPEFIGHKMDYFSLKDFYEHMQSCPDCKEELTIQFLVTDGLHKLETSESFDLQREWDERMTEAQKKLKRGENILQTGFWAEVIAIGVIVGIVLFLLVP